MCTAGSNRNMGSGGVSKENTSTAAVKGGRGRSGAMEIIEEQGSVAWRSVKRR